MHLNTLKKLIIGGVAASMMMTSQIVYAAEKRVMVFGDSNSWGWTPVEEIVPTTRYPKDVRWPGVMAKMLGGDFVVINESLSARTAASTDTTLGINGAGLNGLEYLPAALGSHTPLDLVIIMLGTNDVKPYLNQSTLDISLDIMQLASEVQKSTGVATSHNSAKVLVVAPPPLGKIADVDWLQAVFPETSIVKTQELASILGAISTSVNIPFFDASTVAKIEGVDGVHMLPDSHKALGEALASQVREILK